MSAAYTYQVYSTRSVINEKMQLNESVSYFPLYQKKVNQRLSGFYSQNELDAKLRLAEYPMGLTGDNYIAYITLVIAGSFVVALALAMVKVIPWHYVPAIPFVFWAIPRYLVQSKYESSKAVLKIKLMEFCARLEQGVAGGAQPITVFQKTAESNDLLGNEMKAVVAAQNLNKSLYKAFVEHFVDILHIPEADEIGVMLKNSEERGTVLSAPLKDLNRDFRARRQTELLLKASKIKPAVTIVLTLSVLIATLIFIIGPILMELFRTML